MNSSPYLSDLHGQGAALRATVDRLRTCTSLAPFAQDLSAGRWKGIVLSGMGSSLTALMPLQLALIQAGHLAWCIETSELMGAQRSLLRPDVLVVLASQSGESAEIVRVLDALPREVTVLGITNTEGSTLARRANASVLLRAGTEATVACKTYVATLAAALWAGAVLSGRNANAVLDSLMGAADAIDQYWANYQPRLEALTRDLSVQRSLFYVGRGHSLPSALTAGLITKEATGCAAEGLAAPAFRHGPFELCDARLQLIVFSGDAEARPLNDRLAADAARLGAHVFQIGRPGAASAAPWEIPNCDDALLPLLEILPVQLCTLALARLNGREPGVFRNASKVTRTA
ncbi:SIS domain-containing protein [Nibricoccus sp. IMCC34717]|uniref:SIS domain-containing protein n=1 Tax=Nibricoccus sp. IMCC34717 TaxID=3034021 RepID=UPI00384C8AA2